MMIDLDRLLHDQGFDERLETSVEMPAMARAFISDPIEAERDGLGRWSMFAVNVEDAAHLIVAAPADIESAGCSIWTRHADQLEVGAVATLIRDLTSADALFMLPDGTEVVPSDGAISPRIDVRSSEAHYAVETRKVIGVASTS